MLLSECVLCLVQDGLSLANNTDGLTIIDYLNHTVLNSTVVIDNMQSENIGKYECSAISGGITSSKFINLRGRCEYR